MASDVCKDFRTYLGPTPTDNRQRALSSVSLPHAYYLLRQIVISFKRLDLRPALCLKVQQASEELLRVMDDMCFYLCEYSGEEEQARHGIAKDRADWEPWDELVANAVVDEWTFAGDVIGTARYDKRVGGLPPDYILIEAFDPVRRQEYRR